MSDNQFYPRTPQLVGGGFWPPVTPDQSPLQTVPFTPVLSPLPGQEDHSSTPLVHPLLASPHPALVPGTPAGSTSHFTLVHGTPAGRTSCYSLVPATPAGRIPNTSLIPIPPSPHVPPPDSPLVRRVRGGIRTPRGSGRGGTLASTGERWIGTPSPAGHRRGGAPASSGDCKGRQLTEDQCVPDMFNQPQKNSSEGEQTSRETDGSEYLGQVNNGGGDLRQVKLLPLPHLARRNLETIMESSPAYPGSSTDSSSGDQGKVVSGEPNGPGEGTVRLIDCLLTVVTDSEEEGEPVNTR